MNDVKRPAEVSGQLILLCEKILFWSEPSRTYAKVIKNFPLEESRILFFWIVPSNLKKTHFSSNA